MGKVKITKNLRKGAEGLAYLIGEVLMDETADLGKKKLKKKVYDLSATYTKDERKAAFDLLVEDPAIAANKRIGIIEEVLTGTEPTTGNVVNLEKVKEKLATDAAKVLTDKEKKEDKGENDGKSPKVVLINQDKVSEKSDTKDTFKAKLAHELEFRPKIMKSDMYSLRFKLGRRLGHLFA